MNRDLEFLKVATEAINAAADDLAEDNAKAAERLHQERLARMAPWERVTYDIMLDLLKGEDAGPKPASYGIALRRELEPR